MRSASWALAGLISLVTLPVIWSSTQILSAFGLPDPLLEEGRGYIRAMAVNIVPLLAFVDPLGAAAAGTLQGQDRTRAAMVCSIVGNWVVTAPLIVVLSSGFGLGIRGLWIALVCGAAVSATLTLAHLLLGQGARGGTEPGLSVRNLPTDQSECHTAASDKAARQAA